MSPRLYSVAFVVAFLCTPGAHAQIASMLPAASPPVLSRPQARARVRALPDVVAHARVIAPSRVDVTAIPDAAEIGSICTGSALECLWWFRVVDVASDGRRTTWRFFGVDPWTGRVHVSRARTANAVTTAPSAPVRGVR